MINLPNVTHDGEIELDGLLLSVVVVDNGKRLLKKKSIYKLFGKTMRGRASKKLASVNKLMFVNTKSLEKLIDHDLNNMLVAVKFRSINNIVEEGYDVKLVSKLCKVFVKAKKKKLLKSNNLILAERSIIILEELNKVNLDYLINKSFEFRFRKENKEFTEILDNYLTRVESIIWKELFKDNFYQELFRLNQWTYNVLEIKKRPNIIVKWIKILVFSFLPKTVEDKMQEDVFVDLIEREIFNNETKEVYLSFNSEITTVLTLFKISNNMKEFWRYLSIIKQRESIKIKSPFHFDEKGFTIEPIDESLLSEFNQKLKIALSFNSKSKS